MDTLRVRKKVLSDILITNKGTDNVQSLLNFIQTEYSLDPERLKIVANNLKLYFLPVFQKKWKESLSTKSHFEKRFEKWLSTDFLVSFSETKSKGGRKTSNIKFEDASSATKRRKLMSIEECFTAVEIQDAFLRNLRKSGRKKTANEILALLKSEETEHFNISDKSECEPYVSYSSEEALALMQQARLSKFQYETIHSQAKTRKADIYPIYPKLIEVKKDCYPANIQISEEGATIEIQSLIDHTIQRLFKDPNLCLPASENRLKITYLDFEVKYGIDGLSTEAKYNQKFNNNNLTDDSLFTASMVPILLKVKDTEETVWMNPHSSSPKRCIPIMIKYAKETKELTKAEIKNIKTQVQNLRPTTISTTNGVYTVTTEMKLTMLDGKVCTALTDTPSSSTCYICRATPSQMNDLDRVKQKKVISSNFEFGLSTLHAWIRFMECILHIAYRLRVCKWSVSMKEDKEMMQEDKKRICNDFQRKMGLIIDQPSQGSGNSNCGNTARRFFSDVDKTAEITGVNRELIKMFRNILQMLASRRKIPPLFFEEYAFSAAKLYVSLYPWYYMPSSVHKILIHGGKIMENFMLPIGMYSEEASEARNKDIKYIRQFNTRKMSRLHTMEDLIHKLLESSDLFIASLKPEWEKVEVELDQELDKLIAKFESRNS